VDLTGTPDQFTISSPGHVYWALDEHTHYQVDLTGTVEKVCLLGLPDEHTQYQVYLSSGLSESEWLA
jgi:hypothetical protein